MPILFCLIVKPRRILWAILTGLLMVLLSIPFAQCDSKSRDALVNQIQEEARRHAKMGKEREDQVFTQFHGRSPQLTDDDIRKTYDDAFIAQKEAEETGPLDVTSLSEKLKQWAPWIIAVLALLIAVLKEIISAWFKKIIQGSGRWIYNTWAGSRPFRNVALRHYREALLDRYQKLHIPFRPNRPLDMGDVFVPLKVMGASDVDQLEDALTSIVKNRKNVVLGAPGSGKSMLLKHMALSYAEEKFNRFADQPIPVLLYLHRLNDAGLSLEQYMAKELEDNDFPHAEGFIQHNLERGTLMLLLDGLDEVNSGERSRVIHQIEDLVNRYRDCRFVISCRSAVYSGECSELVDQTFEIVEFNDQQILGFLGSWESEMPSGKSIEHLLQTLHDRPRIMALARNPLLLTIISYLYTDTEFVLPHSRAEFYKESTDWLLDLWHKEHNKYRASAKKLVLQHLALVFQERAKAEQQDRRSLDLTMVLKEIKSLLPDLDYRPNEDAHPLLDEIVYRSGLMLSIDGGTRFQFAHLTLQEFFAAAGMRDNADKLVESFRNDRDTWRETVKLWCGLADDSTDLVERIYEIDPVTALECLADTQKISETTVARIVEVFKSRLEEKDEAIPRAFAAVASDTRPRGIVVFQFLKTTLEQDPSQNRKFAAAQALSLTNLPQAAEVLAANLLRLPTVRQLLVRMGDLAVPSLAKQAAMGDAEAMDGLMDIATPKASLSLVTFLWDKDINVCTRAAWRMAALLPYPNVEETLRTAALPPTSSGMSLDWVWDPFNEPRTSSLPQICGRIASLLSVANEEFPCEQTKLDPRIVVPILTIEYRIQEEKYYIAGYFSSVQSGLKEFNQGRVDRKSIFYNLEGRGIHLSWIHLLLSLPDQVLLNVANVIARDRQSTPSDWRRLFYKDEYAFANSLNYYVVELIFFGIPTSGIIELLLIIWTYRPLIIANKLFLTSMIFLIAFFWSIYCHLFTNGNEPEKFVFLTPDEMLGIVFLQGYESLGTSHLVAFVSFYYIGSLVISYLYLSRYFSHKWIFIGYFLLLINCIILWNYGKRREYKAKTPLSGILSFDSEESSDSNLKKTRSQFFWNRR